MMITYDFCMHLTVGLREQVRKGPGFECPTQLNHLSFTTLGCTQEGIVNRMTIIMALACLAMEFGFYLAIYR